MSQERIRYLHRPKNDQTGIIGDNIFDSVGESLKGGLAGKPISTKKFLTDYARGYTSAVDQAGEAVVHFINAGLVKKSTGKSGEDRIQLTSRGRGARVLGSEEIRRTELAHRALSHGFILDEPGKTEITEQSLPLLERLKVEKITLDAERPSAKVLYLTEILAGNPASDLQFLDQIINRVSTMSPADKPDAVVISGLMEGSHKFRLKDRRSGLTHTLDQQFAAAKKILDKAQGISNKVIYVASNDDREIVHDGTVEAVLMLKHVAKPLTDQKKKDPNYWQIDQLKQSEAWDRHKAFQMEVVLEYCIRNGRRLRSADEVEKFTGGKVRTEEYLLLWDAHQKLLMDQDISEAGKSVLNIDNIPYPGKQGDSLIFTDGVDLKIHTENAESTNKIRESLKFGPTPMYQNPTDAVEAIMKQSLSTPGPADTITIMDQQQEFGIGYPGNKWVHSTGGFTDALRVLDFKTSIARGGQPAAWRQATTRRVLGEPTASSHELTDDKRLIVEIYNRKLIEKADASPDRTTIATFTDWQIGSTTARPDLQVKFADKVFTQILAERPTYLVVNGDIIHGRNYKGMPEENVHMGLIRMEDQQAFVNDMLSRAAGHISPENFRNLLKVGIVPGNHEWNSGYRDNGAIFNLYLEHIFKTILLEKGIVPGNNRVKSFETISTVRGDHFKSWTGIENDIAGHGLLFQHQILEKGGKGGGNKAPIYQAQALFEGQGELMQGIDIGIFGHWHHPQYAVFGSRIAVVPPSLAGLSGYEWNRGYSPVMGGTLLHVGGGKPPQIEFLSADTLYRHKITDGEFSDKELARQGFHDDKFFDPAKHGFVERRSALQKKLWDMVNERIATAHSKI